MNLLYEQSATYLQNATLVDEALLAFGTLERPRLDAVSIVLRKRLLAGRSLVFASPQSKFSVPAPMPRPSQFRKR